MKRLLLAVVASFALCATANAQYGWGSGWGNYPGAGGGAAWGGGNYTVYGNGYATPWGNGRYSVQSYGPTFNQGPIYPQMTPYIAPNGKVATRPVYPVYPPAPTFNYFGW